MRFTRTDAVTPPATAEDISPAPLRVTVQFEIDPLDIVAVAGSAEGVALLLQGGHSMRVDGTWEIIAEKVKMGKRPAIFGAGGNTTGGGNPEPPRREPPTPDEIEERDDVEMFTPHDGPMLVED